jgi:hypothetical protein
VGEKKNWGMSFIRKARGFLEGERYRKQKYGIGYLVDDCFCLVGGDIQFFFKSGKDWLQGCGIRT